MPVDSNLSPLQQSVLVIQDLKQQLESERRRGAAPIAIIGMGCRFPGGADDPETFWRNLVDGVDAMTEVPSDRWDVNAYYDPDPTARGKIYTRRGGFVADIDKFDAAFFGIAPREAESMDPQQRILLETAWHALENAGVAPSRLRGRPVGTFIGVCQTDYAHLRLYGGDSAAIEAHDGAGNGACFIAGRLSYVLGTHGPSLAVDTACSSSLLSVHLACASLRAGECELALAGGVQTIVSPAVSVLMSRLEALSPDGRCHTFDAGACGYARGEGCGVVVLKPLDDAVRDGDRIAAVILGSAVNHDGPSGGLTVPNQKAQETLVREALIRAQVASDEVGYVECHGTGTVLGDPIEVEALGAVFTGRRSGDILIGSVKTNIGHLEGAAGIAGLIKAVLAIEHGIVPPHLNFREGNPRIAWDRLPFRVPTAPTPWPAASRRVAGVSAFGMSGTNVHLMLAEHRSAAAATPAERADEATNLLFLSAKTIPSLRALAARHAAFLSANTQLALRDIAWSLATERQRLRHWLVVAAATPGEAIDRLTRWSRGDDTAASLAGADREVTYRSTASEVGAALLRRAETLLAAGHDFDWAAVLPPGQRLALPIYPFERQRYWVDIATPKADRPTGVSSLLKAGDVDGLIRLLGDNLDVERMSMRRVVETLVARDRAEREGGGLLYRIAWHKRPLTAATAAPRDGTVLVIAEKDAFADDLAIRGISRVAVRPPADPAAAEWVRDAMARVKGKLRAVVYIIGEDADWSSGAEVTASLRRAVGGAASLARAMTGGMLVLVTQGVGGQGSALGSAIWGLGRAVAAERPELQLRLIDMPGGGDSARHLADELVASDDEDEIAYDAEGRRRVARLEPVMAPAGSSLMVTPDASYLVTGGLGALGLATAEFLVARGARHVVLTGRNGPNAAAAMRIAAMSESGARIETTTGDVADEPFFAQTIARLPRLKGVVHAAGIVDDGALAAQSWDRFAAVLTAKAVGAAAIERLTRGCALDWIALYSSGAAVLGSAGQTAYAAANGFMDGFALARRAAGWPMTSIAWGPWSGEGMAGRLDARHLARLLSRGVRPIERERGLQALGDALRLGLGQVTALDIDWRAYAAAGGARRLVSDMTPVAASSALAAAGLSLLTLPPALQREKLREVVTETVRRVLALGDGAPLDPNQGFFDLGMDSTIAVDLRRRLNTALGVALPATIAFEHSTIGALEEYLAREVLAGEETRREPTPRAAAATPAMSAARIAQMSEAEVAALLAERLKELGG
ncbi:MAG TPA: SDR family NAD(P)-dependent oxidoreductase [Stellaceae bacterium]|jgi:3-oxoacyl-(acyl-carrier-protein) synthase/NAD(P)-dependent dehydrogenase (short-subunit alcohol dehydrogenase family)/acyl carrier protein